MRSRRLILAFVIVAGLGLAAGHVSAQRGATIRGRVDVQVPPSRIGQQPEVASLSARASRAAADRRRAVVYLESAPSGAFEEAPARRARIDQRDESFVPHLLAVTVGTTVDFPNSDVTYHNVFSLSKAKPFDLGRYAAGKSKSVTFDRPGIVRVFCDIHSHMSAFVLVFSHRFYAVTDDQGRYAIADVPPGTYVVAVWNEVMKGESRTVTVPASREDLVVDFVMGRSAQ